MCARGGFRPAAFGGGPGHAGCRLVRPHRSCAQWPFCARRGDGAQGAAGGDQLQAAFGLLCVDAANHRRRCVGCDRCTLEGSRLKSMTNFWIRWRVRVGYPVGIAAFWFARPQMKWLLGGAGIAILGLLLRGYAAGHLRKHKQLAVSGPYAFTRNPLYLGSVLLATGFSVASHSWISTLLLAAYLAI